MKEEGSESRLFIWFETFLPGKHSKLLFLFALSCYLFTIQSLLARIVSASGKWPTMVDPIGHVVRHVRLGHEHSPAWSGLFVAPVIESLILIGILLFLRHFRCSLTLQTVVPTGVLCFLHGFAYPIWGVLVLPTFLS